MAIYHIERDHNLTLKEQKKQIKQQYKNVTEIICIMQKGVGWLMVFAE